MWLRAPPAQPHKGHHPLSVAMDPLPEVSASSRKALVPKKAAKRLKAFLESTTPSVASQSDTGEEVLVCEVPEDTLLQLQRVYESISGKKRTLSFAPLFSFGQIEEESTNAASEDPLPHNPTKTVSFEALYRTFDLGSLSKPPLPPYRGSRGPMFPYKNFPAVWSCGSLCSADACFLYDGVHQSHALESLFFSSQFC